MIGFCAAWLAGGELGVYGHAGAVEWLFAVEFAAWLLLPAVVIMFFTARRGEAVVEDIPEAEVVEPAPAKRTTNVADSEDTYSSGDDAPTEVPKEGDDGGVDKKGQEDTEDPEDPEDPESEEVTEESTDDEDSNSGERDGDSAPERD